MSYYQQSTDKNTYDQYGNPLPSYQQPPQAGYAYAVPPTETYQQAIPVAPIKPQETAPTGWRDIPFAILFYINVIAIAIVGGVWGYPEITNATSSTNNDEESILTTSDARALITIAFALCGIAAALSLTLIRVVVKYAKCMITFALWFSVAISFLIVVVGLITGQWVLSIIGAVFAALTLCYAYYVRKRIPFATANLQVAAEAVKKHSSMHCVAFSALFFQVIWIFLWAVAMLGITTKINDDNDRDTSNLLGNGERCTSSSQCASNNCVATSTSSLEGTCQTATLDATSGVAYFFMLVSFFWGVTVVKNVVHTTVAGTVAAWWFSAESSGATGSALKRSVTTSFGSICLGSLIVAILKALKQLAENAREQGETLACVAVCILGCIERLIEYFNKWAFTYVGIYGYKFTQAGKAVFQLFKSRGFDAIINDDLIGNVLGLLSFVIGLLCAGAAVGFEYAVDTLSFDNAEIVVGVLGFVIGLGISVIPLSVLDSAVATVFVCFAEDPAAFANVHRELYDPLVQAWHQLYPDVMASSGYYA